MINEFHRFANNSPDALAELDPERRITFANRRFVNLFLPKKGGIEEGRLDELELSSSCMADLIAGIEQSWRNGSEESFHWKAWVGGAEKGFMCRIIPCGKGEVDGRILIELRDERKFPAPGESRKTREEDTQPYGRSLRNFFSILDELPAFVYLQRQDYTVAYANRKVRDLYGETESRLCYEVFYGRATPCPVCPTFKVFQTGRPVEWEFTDDKGRTFRIHDYAFEDETGERMVMELGIDVTDLKQVEQELFQAQKLRAIGVLAGGLAHDLNNNLVPIIYNIDYSLNRTEDGESKEALSEALQAAQRAARLVEQVLEYSRQQNITREPLHLVPILRESLDAFETDLHGEITFELELEDRYDCVYANAAQMRQVVLNLLQNARQAMPRGGLIKVSLGEEQRENQGFKAQAEPPGGEFITLTFRDTGVGIGSEDMERIFEPFFTTKKSRGGTGMGLAVVHSILSSGGGSIKVESTPGLGTAFTLHLPKAPVRTLPLTGELCVLHGENRRLLIVDDDVGALSAMSRTLRSAGFEVETAQNAEEGLRLFADAPGRFGLVLTDQSMPGMSGLEMSARMLTLNRDARIVICTGHVEPALERRAGEEGVSGFAIKPMTPYTLVEMVRKNCR